MTVMDHADWERCLGIMRQQVLSWSERAAGAPPVIEPESDLAGDDGDPDGARVASFAWYRIVAGVEHLDFCLDALAKTRCVYPTAYMTVLRSSLIAGSIAAWILEPETRKSRQLHAVRVEVDEINNELKLLKDLDAFMEDRADEIRARRFKLEQRRSQCASLAENFGEPFKKVGKFQVDNTGAISMAARHTADADVQGGTTVLWRLGSSAAHVGRWFAVSQVPESDVHEAPDGSHYAHVSGALESYIGPSCLASHSAVARAIELYDRRRTEGLDGSPDPRGDDDAL